jgi:hypothetical protein
LILQGRTDHQFASADAETCVEGMLPHCRSRP